ncbi:phosphatidylinositol N-acetylglucosaminyltransferase subunit Q [Anthonomus grandis grandis]|uniref:phosphatidylinositol N-acetylglucosaminyltransferase subunit Q n=1 Tax=Anthonomus grandis grandis TaxID=2921223 RepID=UPI002165E79B|nr:phosphatidylinositol N-acetylglucosaminyltransferase subunit Q [Anthonomus grandis grandis]
MKNVLVFIPKTFLPYKSGFLEGFYKDYDDTETYYITNTEISDQCGNYIGYTGQILTKEFLNKNTIFIKNTTNEIIVNSADNTELLNVTEVLYDYEGFRKSSVLQSVDSNYGVHIEELTKKIDQSKTETSMNGRKLHIIHWLMVFVNLVVNVFSKTKPVIKNCTILTHFESNFVILKWVLCTIDRNEKTKLSNFTVAKLLDFILGLIFFMICIRHKSTIVSHLQHTSQEFVTLLHHLLIYLMGSPIGLKLNYSFNHSLGKFFFYHINLWKVFLQVMQPILENYFQLILAPALLGLSYLIALLCDIISLATFHVYCIYVYAARLFSLQVRCLTSLWRLFIGRKANPLRNRVDSCEYSSNQLFIGTLGFTMLLFLLPTSTMYYTVFAVFRVATLGMHTLLYKIKDVVNSVPLYLAVLWITKSPSVAGALQIEWIGLNNENSQINLRLAPLPLNECIETFAKCPNQIKGERMGFGKVISRLFTGQLV